MKKTSWFYFLSIFYSVSLVAQDYTVIVLQKGSGDPITNATVVLQDSGEYGETNENGLIKFEDVVFPEKLKVLNSGYETFSLSESSGKSVRTVYLTPLSVDGDLIEVLEERVEEKTSKIVMSSEELRRAPGTQGDTLKAIQSMPGVVTAVEGTGIMYIRGSEPNQSIIWVNRARIGYLYHFGGLHSTISPLLVRDFNMFLGGFPVEYGDALGGALDVKLRTPKKDRWHQYYSVGTYDASVVLEGPIGKKNGKDSMYVSARRSYIDAILDPAAFSDFAFGESDDKALQNETIQVPEFYDVQAVWQRDLKKGRLLVQHFSAGDSIKVVLNSDKYKDPSSAGNLESSLAYHSTSIVWEQEWAKNLYSVSSLYLIHRDQRLRIGQDDDGKPFYLDIVEDDIVWQPELRWIASRSTEIIGGVESIYARTPVSANIVRPPAFEDPDHNFTTGEKFRVEATYKTGMINPYIKFRKTWFNKLKTQLGVRHSYLKSNGRNELSDTSPRASFEYELNKKTTLSGVWGRYLQLSDGSQWVRDAGNPDLKYIEAQHQIAGINYKIDDLWSVQFEAYHKPMKNLVVIYDEPLPNNYQNTGTGRAYGFDLLIKREYSDRKMGWMSYSYLDSKRTEKGVTFPFSGDQRHTFSLVWSQPLSGSWNRWNIGIRARINSGKPYTKVIGRETICKDTNENFGKCDDFNDAGTEHVFSHWSPIRGPRNGSRLPNFYQLDLRIDREFLFDTWKMNVFLDILNVLNIKNIVEYRYGHSYQSFDNPGEELSTLLFPSLGVEIEI